VGSWPGKSSCAPTFGIGLGQQPLVHDPRVLGEPPLEGLGQPLLGLGPAPVVLQTGQRIHVGLADLAFGDHGCAVAGEDIVRILELACVQLGPQTGHALRQVVELALHLAGERGAVGAICQGRSHQGEQLLPLQFSVLQPRPQILGRRLGVWSGDRQVLELGRDEGVTLPHRHPVGYTPTIIGSEASAMPAKTYTRAEMEEIARTNPARAQALAEQGRVVWNNPQQIEGRPRR
jgi:hypothetical protein